MSPLARLGLVVLVAALVITVVLTLAIEAAAEKDTTTTTTTAPVSPETYPSTTIVPTTTTVSQEQIDDYLLTLAQIDAYLRAMAPPPPPPPHTHSVSASGLNLGALRACESGGNYGVVSSNGLYYGAYQFLPSTWDSTARASGMGEWAGTLPSNAPAAVQDAMAISLYNMSGRSQWPVCG